MAEPQAGQAPAGQTTRRIWKISTDTIPLSGPTDATTSLRSDEGDLGHFGWTLTQARDGVIAEKGARILLVPWTRIFLVEYLAEPAPKGTK